MSETVAREAPVNRGARSGRARPRVPRPAERAWSEPAVADRFFRDMVASMRNGVLAITRDGRVVFMNDVAYSVLGVKPTPSDLGRPYAEVLRDLPDIVRILGGAFELSHLPNRAELRLKPSGKVIGYTLAQISDDGGGAAGAALLFKDLTRVEQLEERERLRDRLAALGEMAAAIAHEVKNPLTGIEVMAGILKRQLADSPDAQSLLREIINEAKMANAIVLEVLEFVRPIRLQVERVSLPQALHDAVTTAEAQVTRGDVHVSIDVAPDLPNIQGDSLQLRQLFTNLVANAFEALAGRQGAVEIRAFVADEEPASGPDGTQPMVVVEVSDNGPGVPAEAKDRIFSPFFTTKPRGSGLGLAIVRKIVDAHDGRIDVSTRPEGGTRFQVTLPVRGLQEEKAGR